MAAAFAPAIEMAVAWKSRFGSRSSTSVENDGRVTANLPQPY
jgi:hypothetical protein